MDRSTRDAQLLLALIDSFIEKIEPYPASIFLFNEVSWVLDQCARGYQVKSSQVNRGSVGDGVMRYGMCRAPMVGRSSLNNILLQQEITTIATTNNISNSCCYCCCSSRCYSCSFLLRKKTKGEVLVRESNNIVPFEKEVTKRDMGGARVIEKKSDRCVLYYSSEYMNNIMIVLFSFLFPTPYVIQQPTSKQPYWLLLLLVVVVVVVCIECDIQVIPARNKELDVPSSSSSSSYCSILLATLFQLLLLKRSDWLDSKNLTLTIAFKTHFLFH